MAVFQETHQKNLARSSKKFKEKHRIELRVLKKGTSFSELMAVSQETHLKNLARNSERSKEKHRIELRTLKKEFPFQH